MGHPATVSNSTNTTRSTAKSVKARGSKKYTNACIGDMGYQKFGFSGSNTGMMRREGWIIFQAQ